MRLDPTVCWNIRILALAEGMPPTDFLGTSSNLRNLSGKPRKLRVSSGLVDFAVRRKQEFALRRHSCKRSMDYIFQV